MIHLGDITKINGAEVPMVDVICGGSPCQDLSVAGKRAGLSGQRSGLFMDQIRIIKEMRNECRKRLEYSGADYNRTDIKPRYMVWENVLGAFSSNKGEDFRAVLEETAKVAKGYASIPGFEGGRWSHAGCIMGDGWSIAWRVHDAQFWGVPQRRKRIALVADFGGATAPEILFERKGLSGNIAESREEGESAATDVGSGIEETSRAVVYGISAYDSNSMKSGNPNSGIYEAETSRTLDLNGGSPACNQGGMAVVCVENHPQDSRVKIREDGICQTLDARMGTGGGNVSMVMEPTVASKASYFMKTHDYGKAETLVATDYKNPQLVAYESYQNVTETVDACIGKGTSNQLAHNDMFVANGYIVRRLTPLECERLQGYPVVRKVRFTEMTKDEYIAWNINEGNIVVDTEHGKVFATRGPGGIKLDEPRELPGSVVKGYMVVSIHNGETKMQCKVHRIVWIAEHGVIPDGYVIDHINNDKQDNRLCNLQLLTAAENSTKARTDGLYKIHGDSGSAKITDEVHDFIQYVYGNTDLSIRQLSEIFGISKSRVHQIIHDEPWTDIGDWVDSKGKKHKGESDSPRYKALGNSIALPFWEWMANRMVRLIKNDEPTMASLFDGIGGFPLVFSRCGCKPVWASEIEEFPIAVTKIRFP